MTKKKLEDSEVKRRKQQQKDQLLLNCFIVVAVLIAWIAGKFTSILVSCGVCLLLIILVFTVWWRKSAHLLEQSIKAEELKVHKKKALRNEETAEWLNFILNRWWNFGEASLFQIFKMNLDPVLDYAKPGFIDSMEVVEFTFGGSTPCVKFIKSFEGTRNKPSREGLQGHQLDEEELGSHLLVLDLDLLMSAPDTSIVIRVRLGGKFVGAEVDVAVEDIAISGRLQVVLQLNHKVPFPHIKGVSISFLEKPDVSFDVCMLKALQVMDIPLVKDFINSLVLESLTVALVDPEQIYIPLYEVEGENINTEIINSSYAVGVLTITITGGDYLDTSEDVIWLTLKLGDQEKTLEKKNDGVKETKPFSFLVYDLKNDKGSIEVKGKRSLGTKFTIAKHKLSLKKFDLENTPETSTVLEKPGVKGSRLDISLAYSQLQQIDVQNQTREQFLEKYNVESSVDEVSGVLLVVLHSGSKLLPMDSDGFSDPYCIITANKHWIKTTEHIPNNINPVWESLVEFPVKDVSQITLSFLVYDRDNNWQSKSDDFMGSCNLCLSLENKVIIRQEVELLYKVFGGKNSEDVIMKAGSLCVSAVFRPVASVANTEVLHHSASEGVNDGEDLPGVNASGKPHTAKTMSKTRKQVEEMLLLRERGALTVSILQARDLVAMDNNGLSDPFCVVLVEDEKKYKTKVVNESLEPTWNESVSLPMLAEGETLSINVYDKDVIKNDFMGKITLNIVEILRAAQHEEPVWFSLIDTESGEIQLGFKLSSTDQQLTSLAGTNSKIADRRADVTGIGHTEGDGDSVTEINEENAVQIPDTLYDFSGELIQAEVADDAHPVTVKVKLEIPRKGRPRGGLRASLRSKHECHELLKTDPESPVRGKVQFNATFQVDDNLPVPKDALLSIEFKSSEKKSSCKISHPLEDILKGDLEISENDDHYTQTKWLTVTSDQKAVAELQLMVRFSGSSNSGPSNHSRSSKKKR